MQVRTEKLQAFVGIVRNGGAADHRVCARQRNRTIEAGGARTEGTYISHIGGRYEWRSPAIQEIEEGRITRRGKCQCATGFITELVVIDIVYAIITAAERTIDAGIGKNAPGASLLAEFKLNPVSKTRQPHMFSHIGGIFHISPRFCRRGGYGPATCSQQCQSRPEQTATKFAHRITPMLILILD